MMSMVSTASPTSRFLSAWYFVYQRGAPCGEGWSPLRLFSGRSDRIEAAALLQRLLLVERLALDALGLGGLVERSLGTLDCGTPDHRVAVGAGFRRRRAAVAVGVDDRIRPVLWLRGHGYSLPRDASGTLRRRRHAGGFERRPRARMGRVARRARPSDQLRAGAPADRDGRRPRPPDPRPRPRREHARRAGDREDPHADLQGALLAAGAADARRARAARSRPRARRTRRDGDLGEEE